jgi:hypothetical protein
MIASLCSRARAIGLAALGAGLVLASVAVAADDAKIDLGTTNCSEFLASNGAARKFYVFWFDGYLAAKRGSTVSDANQIQKRLDSVEKACQADVSQKVLPLMEKQK